MARVLVLVGLLIGCGDELGDPGPDGAALLCTDEQAAFDYCDAADPAELECRDQPCPCGDRVRHCGSDLVCTPEGDCFTRYWCLCVP